MDNMNRVTKFEISKRYKTFNHKYHDALKHDESKYSDRISIFSISLSPSINSIVCYGGTTDYFGLHFALFLAEQTEFFRKKVSDTFI